MPEEQAVFSQRSVTNTETMFSETDRKNIDAWNASGEFPVRVRLVYAGDAAGDEMQAFCTALAEITDRFAFVRETEEGEGAVSRLLPRPGFVYQGVPARRELMPFLEGLDFSDEQVPEDLRKLLARLDVPAELRLYVTPHCPHCPRMLRALMPLTVNPFIRLRVIDGSRFGEAAAEDGVLSAPTLVLELEPDQDFRWTEPPNLSEVAALLAERDVSHMGGQAMREMFKSGKAQKVAEWMIRDDRIFPAFPELLKHQKWSVRLGAMVAAEQLAEQAPSLSSRLIPYLWEGFDKIGDDVKGDLLYVIGICGTDGDIPHLENIRRRTGNSEVKEAADEAVENIKQTMGDR